MALAVIHMVASISILIPNLINALRIGDILSENDPQQPTTGDGSSTKTEYPPKYFKVIMESIAFILLETWRLWISIDSVRLQRKDNNEKLS